MKHNKIQCCLLASLLCLLFGGCGKGWFGNEITDMTFKNNADYSITVYSELIPPINYTNPIVYPDTSLPIQYPELKIISIPPGQFKFYSQTSADIPSRFGDFHSDTISIFVFSSDSLSLLGWDSVRNSYNILQRYDISLDEYLTLYNTIPAWEFPAFPPIPEMRNIKMWPPYGTYDANGHKLENYTEY